MYVTHLKALLEMAISMENDGFRSYLEALRKVKSKAGQSGSERCCP